MNKMLEALMNRTILVVTSLVLILVWGGVSAFQMQRDYLPPISNPALIVTVRAQDYQADQVKASVTAPIQEQVRGVDGLESLETNSFDGGLEMSLYFPMHYDMRRAESDVAGALEHASLPAGADKPVVTKVSTSSFPVMRLSLTSPSGKVDETALRTSVQAQVAGELKSLPGVRDVRVTGAGRSGYALSLRMADLSRNGLTIDDVKQSLGGLEPVSMQGTIANSQVSIPLHASGWSIGEQELGQLPIRAADGRTVPLSAVADLSRSLLDQQTIARTDGAAAVYFDVLKTPSSDITDVSQKVRSRIRDIPGVQAGDIRLSVLFDQGEQVKGSLFALLKEGLLGCLLSMVCIFLFYRNVRSTALVALSLPVCLMATTGLLKAMGVSLNLLTVSGLIVAMGRVIDDTIVVLDNMYRKSREAQGSATPLLLAGAVGEMLPAIVSSTATTVAVYIPIAIVGGMIGSAFSGFAWSVVIALLASLLVAMLVVPALYHFWHRGRTGNSAISVEPASRKLLGWAFRRKKTIVGAFALLFGIAGAGACILPVNFLPASRTGQINVQLEFPEGTAMTQMDGTVIRIEQTLKTDAEIATFSSILGSSFTPQFDDVFDAGGGWMQGENVANISVSIRRKGDIDTVIAKLRQQLPNVSGNAVCTVTNQNIAGDDSQLQIDLTGSDAATLDRTAQMIGSKLRQVQGLSVVGAASEKEAVPGYRLVVNKDALERTGIGAEQVMQRIRDYLSEGSALEVKTGEHETVPVAVHPDSFAKIGHTASAISDAQTEILTMLGKETFKGKDGHDVRMDELASLSPGSGPSVIREREGRPFSVVTANITSRDVEKAAEQAKDAVSQLVLPAGVRYSINGISAQVDQMIYEMGLAISVSILLVLAILSVAFRGWRAPLAVLACIPLAFVGSVIGMLATGGEWNLASLVGLLMLAGIVATNGIVLADKIERNMAIGMLPKEAILQGTASRVRPVLMTAATTVLTLLPLCFSGGSDTVVSQSLGIVVVCGMISSTFTSLLLIPLLYEWVYRPGTAAGRFPAIRRKKLIGGVQEN